MWLRRGQSSPLCLSHKSFAITLEEVKHLVLLSLRRFGIEYGVMRKSHEFSHMR